MTNGPVMNLVEMLNKKFPVIKPQIVTENEMTPEEIKRAEISEAKQAEEAVLETPPAEIKVEEPADEVKEEVKPVKKTRRTRS